MSVKVNIGVCKKIGLENYGSAGSHCDIELELDFATMQNPDEFQKQVQNAYRLCRESVESELVNHHTNGRPKQDTQLTTPPKTEYRNSSAPERTDHHFPVSSKQLGYIDQLSKKIKGLTGTKLDEYCQANFGKVCNQLSSQEASKLIDAMKNAKAGKEGLA